VLQSMMMLVPVHTTYLIPMMLRIEESIFSKSFCQSQVFRRQSSSRRQSIHRIDVSNYFKNSRPSPNLTWLVLLLLNAKRRKREATFLLNERRTY